MCFQHDPQLTPKHATSYEPIVSQNLTIFLERLGHAAGSPSRTFNIAPHVRRFTFDTRKFYRMIKSTLPSPT